jgi:hypothetical protein
MKLKYNAKAKKGERRRQKRKEVPEKRGKKGEKNGTMIQNVAKNFF